MNAQTNETSLEWAERQFGACALGDQRRTRRAVQVAAAMHAAPDASIPQQMKSWKATKAAYRFLSDEAYQDPDLLQPHWDHTRQQAGQHALVLLVQDATTLDTSRYAQHIHNLALVGDNRGEGYQLNSVLAILPHPRRVLGLADQRPFFRQPHPADETRRQRARRFKESDVWVQAVQAIGQAPEGVRWVHIGDRGADIYALFETCEQQGCDFLVRICQNRRMFTPSGEQTYLKTFARQLPAVAEQTLPLPARPGQPAREAGLHLAYHQLELSSGWMNAKRAPLPAWVIRVWEEEPPEGARADRVAAVDLGSDREPGASLGTGGVESLSLADGRLSSVFQDGLPDRAAPPGRSEQSVAAFGAAGAGGGGPARSARAKPDGTAMAGFRSGG